MAFNVRHKTTMIERRKVAGSAMVIAGFALWIVGTQIVGDDGPWKLAPSYAIGGASFVIVAWFLPDVRPATFLSRRSALGLAAFFAWLAGNQVFAQSSSDYDGNLWDTFLMVGLPVIVAFGLYWLSLVLIRRLRAATGFEKEGEQGEAPNRR